MSNQLYSIISSQPMQSQNLSFILIALIYSIATLIVMIKLVQYLYTSAKMLGKKHPIVYPAISLIFPFVWIIVGIVLIRNLKELKKE